MRKVAIALAILVTLLTGCNDWDGCNRSDWQRQAEITLYENGQALP